MLIWLSLWVAIYGSCVFPQVNQLDGEHFRPLIKSPTLTLCAHTCILFSKPFAHIQRKAGEKYMLKKQTTSCARSRRAYKSILPPKTFHAYRLGLNLVVSHILRIENCTQCLFFLDVYHLCTQFSHILTISFTRPCT